MLDHARARARRAADAPYRGEEGVGYAGTEKEGAVSAASGDGGCEVEVGGAVEAGGCAVRFEGVTFRYASRDVPALVGMSFEVCALSHYGHYAHCAHYGHYAHYAHYAIMPTTPTTLTTLTRPARYVRGRRRR